MTRVDELKNQIVNLKNEAESLKNENKIDEALKIVDSIKELKTEIEKEELSNKENIEILNSKGDKNTMERVLNKEEKIFVDFIREGIANGMTTGNNGALIPNTIASQIINKVTEISPLYARATKFNVGGDLTFVLEDAIPTCNYMDEMGAEAASDATFKTVKLGSFIARALSKISRSLVNRSDFDILNYVVDAVAKSIAKFLEKELINGTSGKITGLSTARNTKISTAINADTLIDLQMEVPSALQANCEWLMNPSELKAIRKFKGVDGTYLLNMDATKEFGYSLLGKNVLLSDQVPSGKIFYGDFSGLYVKLANDVEVSVLKERYAEQYAIGVVGFVELDAKVVETQKITSITKQG